MAKSRHVATDPRYPPPFAGARQDNREGSSSNDENDGDPNSKRNRKKNMMDESERKKKLEDDPWALEVTPISVRCGACTRLVSLDKRSRFYPGLWLKHREKCMEIKRLEAIEQEQGDVSAFLVVTDSGQITDCLLEIRVVVRRTVAAQEKGERTRLSGYDARCHVAGLPIDGGSGERDPRHCESRFFALYPTY